MKPMFRVRSTSIGQYSGVKCAYAGPDIWRVKQPIEPNVITPSPHGRYDHPGTLANQWVSSSGKTRRLIAMGTPIDSMSIHRPAPGSIPG